MLIFSSKRHDNVHQGVLEQDGGSLTKVLAVQNTGRLEAGRRLNEI